MASNLQISGVHRKLSKDLEAYVEQKIGRLDRYVSEHARESLKIEVKLKESPSKDKANCTCEVIMHLPQERLTVNERAVSMHAAIDAAEDTLKVRLKKYKNKHAGPRLHRRLLSRIRSN